MDVAYAAHFRALLEFFHDGRDGQAADQRDLHYRDACGARSPFRWTSYGRHRLEDADRLVGHLSRLRPQQTSDWDSDDDWDLVLPMIRNLVAHIQGGPEILPKTVGELARLGTQ